MESQCHVILEDPLLIDVVLASVGLPASAAAAGTVLAPLARSHIGWRSIGGFWRSRMQLLTHKSLLTLRLGDFFRCAAQFGPPETTMLQSHLLLEGAVSKKPWPLPMFLRT
jgi:hypothetical protein